jgi:chromosome segregation protein
VESLDREYGILSEELRNASAIAQEAERRFQRSSSDLEILCKQIEVELGPLDVSSLAEGRLRVTLPDRSYREVAIERFSGADQLRERLTGLRSALRQLPVNRDVITEYEATRERYHYLERQLADLSGTATTLRTTVEETRDTMRERFELAFAAICSTFSDRFRELFGGGSARLVLGPVGDINGVDIIAQPPGKRSQSLATLSGGERALAAAALLFALIEASPPPFCVLDEVDAALDEGNVGRFCAALQDLSDRTQFIIITHNRRTMESASTIYGLTLENRCESRILSLRLPEGPGTGEPKAGIRNAKRERAEPSSSISSHSPML